MLRCICLAVGALVVQLTVCHVQLPSGHQIGPDPPPSANVNAHVAGDKSVIVLDSAVVAIDQIEDGVVGAALLERKSVHPDERRSRVTLVPFQDSHHMPPFGQKEAGCLERQAGKELPCSPGLTMI